MADKTINTVIVLRNDKSTAWEKSDYVLLEGEVGICYLDNGNVIAKLGDGKHTWADLSQIEGVLEKDLILTYAFGRYTPSDSGYVNAGGKGMTTREWLEYALSETKEPTITQPSFALTASTADAGKEIGEYITSITWNGSSSYGSYEYGPATGLSAANRTWAISNSVDSQTSTKEDGTFTLTSDKYIQLTQEASKNYATVTGTYTLDASGAATPLNNVGAETAGKITDKTGTITANVAATAYRKAFWGVKTPKTAVDTEALTSTQVRTLGNSTTQKDKTPSNIKVPAGSQQVIIALKKGLKNTLVAKDANANNSVVTFTKKAAGASVEGANSFDAIDYDVWYVDWNPDKVPTYTGIGSAKDLNLSWS